MGKILTLTILSLFALLLLPTVLAAEPAFIFKQNTPVDLCLEIFNENLSLATEGTTCFLTLKNPQMNISIANKPMRFDSLGRFCYDINGSKLNALGEYPTTVTCNSTIDNLMLSFTSLVTTTGTIFSTGQSILYVVFLVLLILIFFLNFYGMGYLPSRNQRDEQGRIMSINNLKYFRNVLWMTGYFLFIGIVYISSNLAFAFLGEELLAKTLFMIFRISFMFSPVIIIVWVVFIFASIFHDREFQRMLNRGMFPGGQL